MRQINLLAAILIVSTSISCMPNKKKDAETNATVKDSTNTEIISERNATTAEEAKTITIDLNAKSNSDVSGSITFEDNNGKVSMKAEMSGLTAGKHAIHLHETADCSSEDGKSAGGHWNPTNEKHGKWGDSDGYHRGDIGNFEADEDGNATFNFSSDEWCIGCADQDKNIVGRAVIVHEGKDDFTSQPSGDAGKRVACAAIVE